MAKVSEILKKRRQKKLEIEMFEKAGWIKVDPTEKGFFDSVIQSVFYTREAENFERFVQYMRKMAEELKGHQEDLKPFWRPTFSWNNMKRVFFRDAPYSRPHSLEWWTEYMERFNTGEYVHQVKLGNEVQYKLVMIWLVNHWMHERDLPAVDALKMLYGGSEPYGEKPKLEESIALGKENFEAIMLDASTGDGLYFVNEVPGKNVRDTCIIIPAGELEFYELPKTIWLAKPWIIVEE